MDDVFLLLHPAIAVTVVFPLIGMVVRMAWQTRQRRLVGKTSKIPPGVGTEHVQLGRWLTGTVVAVALLGLLHPIAAKMIARQAWNTEPMRMILVGLIFVATAIALGMLYRARTRSWRIGMAGLTSLGLLVLGAQPEVFRRDSSWYMSHYYYGVTVAILMIISLAMIPEIYHDRASRWRKLHIILNSIAFLLFVGQGMTGARDLLEIPVSWQKPYVEQLYKQKCQTQPCTVQSTAAPGMK